MFCPFSFLQALLVSDQAMVGEGRRRIKDMADSKQSGHPILAGFSLPLSLVMLILMSQSWNPEYYLDVKPASLVTQ